MTPVAVCICGRVDIWRAPCTVAGEETRSRNNESTSHHVAGNRKTNDITSIPSTISVAVHLPG